jgi:hypothetical protein
MCFPFLYVDPFLWRNLLASELQVIRDCQNIKQIRILELFSILAYYADYV